MAIRLVVAVLIATHESECSLTFAAGSMRMLLLSIATVPALYQLFYSLYSLYLMAFRYCQFTYM